VALTGRPLGRRHLLRLAATLTSVAGGGILAACGGTGSAGVPATTVATTTAAVVATAAPSPAQPAAGAATASTSQATRSTPAPAATAPAAAGVTLTFWEYGKTDPSYAAWVQRIQDFNRANPATPAAMVDMASSDIDQKLPATVAGGTPPNVAIQNRVYLPASAATGLMQDISAYANRAGIKGEDEQPWVWPQVFIKGKLYGLPYSTDSRMIYVNVSHLQQAGLPATAPKTLEEFAQIGQHLTKKQGDTYLQLGFFPWSDNWSPYGWAWLFGGSLYDAAKNHATLDDTKVVAAFDWAGSLARQLGYQAVQDFIKAHNGNLFIAQVLSGYINSTSFLVTVANAGPGLNWTPWAPPPPKGVQHTSTWSGGFADVLPTGAKNPDQSFALLNYLTDATMQRLQNKSGRLPTIKAVAADPYWATVDPRIKQFVDILPSSHSYPVTPQINILNTQFNSAYTAVLSGKQTSAEALKAANQFVNTAIQENRV
jgi:multiple sugar transport system substrate-binding protein